ncbi:MAG: hypothetical protein JO269_03110 [Burkholderiaceae bacterium]|nr:hypothetical protein [Burkholderiaceae bacterium]
MPVSSVNSNLAAYQAAQTALQGPQAQRSGFEAATGAVGASAAAAPVAAASVEQGAAGSGVAGIGVVIANPFRVGVAAYAAIMNSSASSTMLTEA